MSFAYPTQKFQDWFTQQWVIMRGRRIDTKEYAWLMGPFGEVNGIGENFIYQLAERENLDVVRNLSSTGLLSSIADLKFDIVDLSPQVIDFYERTSDYKLDFHAKWNRVFRVFASIVNRLFSRRINQLNIPTTCFGMAENLSSEIIELVTKENKQVKYVIWLRKIQSSGSVVYSGVYTTCQLPSGVTCIKAIFPLPMGNATVILKPSVGEKNELILDSSGRRFGDAGFYFLLADAKGKRWSRYLRSFTDNLVVREENGMLKAEQTLRVWGIKAAIFNYRIERNRIIER